MGTEDIEVTKAQFLSIKEVQGVHMEKSAHIIVLWVLRHI